jgi:hypothetical protein
MQLAYFGTRALGVSTPLLQLFVLFLLLQGYGASPLLIVNKASRPKEALYVPTFSHLLIVNKLLSLSLSPPPTPRPPSLLSV